MTIMNDYLKFRQIQDSSIGSVWQILRAQTKTFNVCNS